MPLIKSASKDAFSRNVSAEMHAGRPQNQALAIAYSTQRRAMADGGDVDDPYAQARADFWGQSGTEVPEGTRPTPFDWGGFEQTTPPSQDWQRYPSMPQSDYETGQAESARESAAGTLARRVNPSRPSEMSPELESKLRAFGTSAADPFGLPSYATGLYSPQAKQSWRDSYENEPVASLLGSALSPIPLPVGAAMRGMAPIGKAMLAAPRTALGGTAATAAMMPSVAGEAEAQPWVQQQERPPQRDYRAVDQAGKTRAERDKINAEAAREKATRDAEQRQLQQSMPSPNDFKARGLDPEAWQRRWFSLNPEQRSSYATMPPPDQLGKLRVTPEAWMSMGTDQHRDTLYGLSKLEEAERLKNTPFLEKHPEVSTGAMGLAWLAAARLGFRANSLAKKEIGGFMGEWEKAQNQARSVLMQEGAPASAIKDAKASLRTWDTQFDALQKKLSREQMRARILGGTAGLQGALMPYELDAALGNTEMAGKQMLKPETWARLGISAFTGAGGASIANALTSPWPSNLHTLKAGSQYLQGGPNRGTIKTLQDMFQKRKTPLPYAAGGGIPWFARQEAKDMSRYGMMHGATPGRADARPTGVRGGSYVVPADIVSGLGQGNSMSGASKLNHMFNMNPKSGPTLPGVHASARMVRQKFAQGGEIPIKVSDGEFLIPPEKVAEIGGGDINHGHDILDSLVKIKRQETIRHLASLPGPRDSQQERADGGGGWDDEFENSGNQFSPDESDMAGEAPVPEPLNRSDPMLRATQPYGINQEYGQRRIMGLRNPSIFGYD